jgi:DnaJ-class molecular chaperone
MAAMQAAEKRMPVVKPRQCFWCQGAGFLQHDGEDHEQTCWFCEGTGNEKVTP